MKLVIATSNRGKIAEFEKLLENSHISFSSLMDYPGMPEIVEDGATFLENALEKARQTSSLTGRPALADDSGLEVDALDGKPGVLSARFAPTSGARNSKLLDMLASVPDHLRTARFVCALILIRPDGFEWTTTGICEGKITHKPQGDRGFGYDPVFYYEPFGKTFAEIPPEIKNTVSHRGRAMQAFKDAVVNEHILKYSD